MTVDSHSKILLVTRKSKSIQDHDKKPYYYTEINAEGKRNFLYGM